MPPGREKPVLSEQGILSTLICWRFEFLACGNLGLFSWNPYAVEEVIIEEGHNTTSVMCRLKARIPKTKVKVRHTGTDVGLEWLHVCKTGRSF